MATRVPNEFYPDSSFTFALFTDVQNAKELKQCVMTAELEVTLLKTSMVVDPFQVLVAANKAVHSYGNNKMMTKNVHSEVLYSLSPTKNISDAFRKFGMGDTDKSVFVVIVDDVEDQVLTKVTSKVQGNLVPLEEVRDLADVAAIKKVYKINDKELECCGLVDSLVSRISSKEIVTV